MHSCVKQFLISILVLATYKGNAQYIIVGQNSFAGTNIYGPMTSDVNRDTVFSRHAYIYPEAVLDGLEHGDSIRSIEFFKSSTDTYIGNPNFKLYINNSNSSDYGPGKINWVDRTKVVGLKKVFDDNPRDVSGSTTGWKRFEFNTPYVYDTTRGKNLEILAQYTQDTRQAGVISWVYENDFTVPQFVSSNESKYVFNAGSPTDSTLNSNVRKPYVKINFFRYRTNLETAIVYALGQMPVLMGAPDTIRAIVRNAGLDTVKNHTVFLNVDGANHFLDSTVIGSLAPHEETLVEFVNHEPDTQGREFLDVYVAKDDYSLDDSASTQRAVNYNVYSHADPYQNIAGGIGFNGSTGDFVARFYSDTIRYINQVKVDFSQGGQPFQVGIWEEGSGGMPGTNIYTSDTLTSVSGTYVLALLPRVKVNKGFFVGIRQTGTTNVAFGFQSEVPIRPGAFFFAAPLGNANWVPFSPGFNFKFNIQPRIQVANDVGMLSLDYPGSGDTLDYSETDSLGPVLTVINYGFNDQKAPFDVICEILDQGLNVVYRSTRTITIKANDTVQVTFDSSFSQNNLGRFQVRAYTRLHSDLVRDNDTFISTFDIVIRHDLAVERFFSPVNGENFEMNKDSIWPIIRVLNNGIIDKTNVDLYFRLRSGKQVLHQQVKQFDLAARQSVILDFDTVTLPVEGDIIFEAFVDAAVDSFRINDTARIVVQAWKTDDIGVTNIKRPNHFERFEVNSRFQPFVDIRNFGRADQDSFWIYASIYNENDERVYLDSNLFSLTKFSTTQSIFGYFNTGDSVHTYRFEVVSDLFRDQDPTNDTLSNYFKVVDLRDLAVVSINIPEENKTYLLGSSVFPEVRISNLGLNSLKDSSWLYIEIFDAENALFYSDSSKITAGLRPDSLVKMIFSKELRFDSKQEYRAIAYINWPSDRRKSNDTASIIYLVSPLNNLTLSEILVPVDQNVYQLNIDALGPVVRVINDGLADNGDSTFVHFEMYYQGNTVYSETSKGGPITLAGFLDFAYINSYIPSETGVYTYRAVLRNSIDQFAGDDTLYGSFTVTKDRDIAVIENVFPSLNDEVFYNLKIAPKATFKNLGERDESSDFTVSYQIFRNQDLKFNSNQNIQLKSDSSTTVVFDSVFFPQEVGKYQVMIINRSSFDQDTRNDTLEDEFNVIFGVGIDELRDYWSISVDPNPANERITVRFNDRVFNLIQLVDLNGRVIKTIDAPSSINILDVSSLAQGPYYLKLQLEHEVLTHKVLIAH